MSDSQSARAWPPHGGEIARLIRERDWSQSPIGPPHTWPATLRQAVDLMLASPAAISVSWARPATFFYNDAFIRIAGRRHPAVFGGSAQRDWPEVAAFTGQVLRQVEAGQSVMLRGQPLDILHSGVAEHACFDVAFSPINDEASRQVGLLVIVNEVTELARTRAELQASETRFRQFADAAPQVLCIREAATLAIEYLSPASERVFGQAPEALSARADVSPWLALVHPDDRQGVLDAFDRVRGGARVARPYRIRRPDDGQERWVQSVIFPLFDGEGGVERIGSIATDITHERRAVDRNAVLMAELQHRSRNLLAVVTAIARRTLRRGGSVESFEERLMALSRAQSLLSEQGSARVQVEALVRAELAAHADARPPKVTLGGEPVLLCADQVQNLSLALHELTTNAVKYGALSQPQASLSIRWATRRADDGERLTIDWEERDVDMAPAIVRRGFGRELIERALGYAVGASTRYELGADGVSCSFELPLGVAASP